MPLQSEPLPMDDADALLARRCAQGDREAFDVVVRRHQARIAALVYRLLGWPEDVDDVVQEVFLAAMQALPRFRGESGLATWLTRIAVNKCRSWRRRRLLRFRWWLDAARQQPHVADELAGSPAADRRLVDFETVERVRLAVRRLSARDREVVVLRYLEQMPIEEICAVLAVNANVLQVRLHRARARLRASLADVVSE